MKKLSLLQFLLVAFGSILGCFVQTGNPAVAQIAPAQQNMWAAKNCTARKWEYCQVTMYYNPKNSKDGKFTAYVDIWYSQLTGRRIERITAEGLRDEVFVDAQAKAMAKLGEEGWEMFHVIQLPSYEFYFRRCRME